MKLEVGDKIHWLGGDRSGLKSRPTKDGTIISINPGARRPMEPEWVYVAPWVKAGFPILILVRDIVKVNGKDVRAEAKVEKDMQEHMLLVYEFASSYNRDSLRDPDAYAKIHAALKQRMRELFRKANANKEGSAT